MFTFKSREIYPRNPKTSVDTSRLIFLVTNIMDWTTSTNSIISLTLDQGGVRNEIPHGTPW
jgi:hypothetical protein